jgi:hypothetical protein
MVLTLVFVALKSNILHDVCDAPSWRCDVSWPFKCGALVVLKDFLFSLGCISLACDCYFSGRQSDTHEHLEIDMSSDMSFAQ